MTTPPILPTPTASVKQTGALKLTIKVPPKRKREDLTVLSMNVAGTDPDEFGRAVKRLKPDIILTQENPGKTARFSTTLASTLDDISQDAAVNGEFAYDAPLLVPEFFTPGLTITTPSNKSFVCYADVSVKKHYAVCFNRRKFRLRKKPALVDYTADPHRQRDLAQITRREHANEQGFGARPPIYFELEQIADNKRIGVFNWHAPPQNDLNHDVAMDMFEESEQLAASQRQNHVTLIAGDFNDRLQNRFGPFGHGVDQKFDHVRADSAASARDLRQDHGDVLNTLSTAIQDHYAQAVGFNFQ